ncbi:peptidyl-prolyl cis-trans isomerase [Lysinibacillus sp. 54212]|uniref:peptidyl-prolyl cis-trans isomerase n=1 Tax=Lysinibacillus sp. 54212 TaxID=3119829 RepID=UPI002FC616C2
MKSMRNNNRGLTPQSTPTKIPLSQRRLKTKPALTLLGILLLGNIFWFVLWLLPSGEKDSSNEPVATIDGDKITRQQWLSEMESRYGKETLQDLVNEAVMEKASEKYDINVSKEEIELEIALMHSAQDTTDTSMENLTKEQLHQKIRAQLILEKVLAKDIVIKDKQTAAYYKENKSLYNIPTSYRTSIIMLKSKNDAENVQKELKSGSEFSVLAREHSLDTASASLGGDIGYVTADQDGVDRSISSAVQKLKKGEVSGPVSLSDGRYALLQVLEVNKGQEFTYEEVQGHIARELAMEQLPSTIAPEVFWSEFKAKWYYGEAQ